MFPFFCFRWCCLVFGSDHLLLFASLLVVHFFLAFNGVLDVDDIFLKCLEIGDVSQRRSCIDDFILSGMSGTYTMCSGMIS